MEQPPQARRGALGETAKSVHPDLFAPRTLVDRAKVQAPCRRVARSCQLKGDVAAPKKRTALAFVDGEGVVKGLPHPLRSRPAPMLHPNLRQPCHASALVPAAGMRDKLGVRKPTRPNEADTRFLEGRPAKAQRSVPGSERSVAGRLARPQGRLHCLVEKSCRLAWRQPEQTALRELQVRWARSLSGFRVKHGQLHVGAQEALNADRAGVVSKQRMRPREAPVVCGLILVGAAERRCPRSDALHSSGAADVGLDHRQDARKDPCRRFHRGIRRERRQRLHVARQRRLPVWGMHVNLDQIGRPQEACQREEVAGGLVKCIRAEARSPP
eukprot:scaffold4097_cov306-Pinguiococcus_pyrenoidosus.AAC.16